MTIEARTLAIGYPSRVVGEGIDLALAPREAVALLGPNGGGKTTLLKTLIGLLPPLSGTVLLDGVAIAAVAPKIRARAIGYVPQAHAGTFAFTAAEVVLMGRTAHTSLFARPSARDVETARAMLDRLGIAHLADRPYTMISGGERQLVLVARALAQEPRYVVLDEPTASLDFGNQGKVTHRIAELAREGLGVLFTTHDPNQALRFATRVAMIRDGRLIASGAPDAVLDAERLESLYHANVRHIEGEGGSAFLPG